MTSEEARRQRKRYARIVRYCRRTGTDMTPREDPILTRIATLPPADIGRLFIETGTPFRPGEPLAEARAFIAREYRAGRLHVNQLIDTAETQP